MQDKNTYKSRAKHIMRGMSEETLLSDSMTVLIAARMVPRSEFGKDIWDGD